MRTFFRLDNLFNVNGGKFNFTLAEWEDMDEFFEAAVADVMRDADYKNRAAQQEFTQKADFAKAASYGSLGPPNMNNFRF